MLALEGRIGGFNFDNTLRNENLLAQGLKVPNATKTGTTIVGCVFNDGVVLGADTRATGGTIVADKNCEKIHYMAPNIYCCGAGTAADCDMMTRLICSQLELHRLYTKRESRIITAVSLLKHRLFKYRGYIGAALIVGGYDINGPSLYTIHPHGSTAKLPYITMGSGSYAAMAVLESRWKEGINEQEAIEMVKEAVLSGIKNDLGSGSNVDVCIITKSNVNYIRGYYKTSEVRPKAKSYKFQRGTTRILTENIYDIVEVLEGDQLNTSMAVDD